MNSDEISIRSIQHYLYCPHRWGLIEIGRVWSENAFVTKANLIHKRVHDSENSYSFRGKRTYTSVAVYNDEEMYNLYGVTDCLEMNDEICIVEYKPTKPASKDYNFEDLIQVFAQKVCVDNVFDCDCNGVIYYSDVKKRVKLPLRENYDEYDGFLKSILNEMRQLKSKGVIPPIKKGQKCSGCSMRDLCMPSLKINKSIHKNIKDILEAGNEKTT